jgi:hypothetical protein
MSYNPERSDHRRLLAERILDKLEVCDFIPIDSRGERVFGREVDSGVWVYVYTSIVGDSVRRLAKDAIRVVGIYHTKDGNTRGLFKNARVNRVGDVDDIVNRMYERMRETWLKCANNGTCNKCGSPLFVSRAGNSVCSEICWVD